MGEAGRWRVRRGPLLLGLVYAITSILALPTLEERAAVSTLSAVGILAGLLGITGFALNIILGARLPGAPRLLGGLEGLYALHRVNGRVAYLFILLHVCLIAGDTALDSAAAAIDLFTFRAGMVITLGAIAFLGMTAALAATLYARLTHETFVYVQRSFGLVFVVAAFHAFSTPGVKGSSAPLTTYLGALTLVAFAGFAYRSLFGNLLVRRFDYAVSRVTELDRSVVEIEMLPLERALNARPGQFVFVTFYSQSFEARFHPVSVASEGDSAVVVLRPGDARDQFHPFSLTSTPADRHLSLVIKAVGDFTSALHALEPGARARVEGPYGEFSFLAMPRRRQVWIAGGIGITPFLSMARSRPGIDYSIDLFWGVNDRGRAYFAEELASLAAELPSFRFHLVPEDEAGFITSDLLREKATLEHADVLIVGPPPMERALRAQLRAAGVPARRIHSERFAFGAPSSR
ncbi:MAG: ferredoxin reductase family protein [Actinomycetota bacterium]|nr:ferredoxin reductase family protein [Actinomycetota bacterium]